MIVKDPKERKRNPENGQYVSQKVFEELTVAEAIHQWQEGENVVDKILRLRSARDFFRKKKDLLQERHSPAIQKNNGCDADLYWVYLFREVMVFLFLFVATLYIAVRI